VENLQKSAGCFHDSLYAYTVADVPVLIYLDIIRDLSGSIWIHLKASGKRSGNVDHVSMTVYLLKPVALFYLI
jgi:hypothetical protein